MSVNPHPLMPPDPNVAQQKASHPESIVWVSASAGSGKTKVLTDRVLRLLLPDPQERWRGTRPHRLLCITFTKAGAAEMALRVQAALGKWAVLDEGKLAEDLGKLTGETPKPHMIAAARKLFADVLDCPGGLKIMTIHSFCQSVLGRFPLEAGVNPDFTVLDDQMAQQILSDAVTEVLQTAQESHHSDLNQAFRRLAVLLQLDDLEANLRQILQKPEILKPFFGAGTSFASLDGDIRAALGLARDANLNNIHRDFVMAAPESDLRDMIRVFAGGSKTVQAIGLGFQLWLDQDHDQRLSTMGDYVSALFTGTGSPRKLGKCGDDNPAIAAIFGRECERYLAYKDTIAALRQSASTAALMTMAHAVLILYEAEKKRLGALDYNDLIRKTDDLLKSTSGAWVHFKLDGGIDHILMDEAQDTNPHQWSIMERLSSEIFAGAGREAQGPRSLFIVGDTKQSIFSFQGADPAAFDKLHRHFAEQSRAVERELQPVPLDMSFRSVAPVLKLVDMAFDAPDLRRQIGLDPGQPLMHYSFRAKDAGLVELWPLRPKPPRVKTDTWQLPFAEPAAPGPQGSLAEEIAAHIHFLIQKKDRLESLGRAVTPGDFLILVRTRNALVHDLVRQLKRRGVPVSGIDRLTLGDQIAVQDLLALARFVRLPEDDFSLACVLKSPLIGLDEDGLMELALGRTGTLWESLQASARGDIVTWLGDLILLCRDASPFEFMEKVLNLACPGDSQGTGWRAMTARLGDDVIDPLEELMSLCLKLEPQGVRTLEDLILWQQKSDVEIKREMEDAGGQVRIMTVHAAKGLEAPIVILPDTTSVPTRTDRFIWPDKTGIGVPLWSARSDDECAAFTAAKQGLLREQEAEHARLLYVALTRARDRLYVMGAESGRKGTTWYDLVAAAFGKLDGVETVENGRRRLQSDQMREPQTRVKDTRGQAPVPAAPDWLWALPQAEAAPLRAFSPSRLDEDTETDSGLVHSPVDAAQPHRFRRGIITHKLFQVLPDLDDARREDAARYYVARAGRDLPESVQASIVNETLRVLRDPVFAPVFGAGSIAEVPVTGVLDDGRLINGQIDRLVIKGDDILIVDYKTNRPSPRSPDDVPVMYRRQLAAYAAALRLIYPNSLIKCALLWTDQPLLMPVTI